MVSILRFWGDGKVIQFLPRGWMFLELLSFQMSLSWARQSEDATFESDDMQIRQVIFGIWFFIPDATIQMHLPITSYAGKLHGMKRRLPEGFFPESVAKGSCL